jgi:hypothetical protein
MSPTSIITAAEGTAAEGEPDGDEEGGDEGRSRRRDGPRAPSGAASRARRFSPNLVFVRHEFDIRPA